MTFSMAFNNQYSKALSVLILSLVAWFVFRPKQRYPDAPWLRVSTKPGRLGLLEDQATFQTNPMAILSVGWERYSKHGINYMLDTMEGKRYIVAPKYLDEIVRAPDTHVSALTASNDLMQIRHTLHPLAAVDQFHFDLPIRKSLTQALGPRLLDIVEEGKLAIDEYIGHSKDWKPLNGMETSFNVVARTANRLLFGIPLTRNKEFHQLSIDYTFVMFGGADIVRKYPNFMKQLVLWWSTKLYPAQALAQKLLMPLLEERVREEKDARANGIAKQREKPNDMIQWILDYAVDEELQPSRLVYRMLHINVAAVHTSSQSFGDVLFTLGLFPQYQDDLREEIIQIFRQEDGWSKETLTLLVKMDSFITECGRIQPNATIKNMRVTIRDWQFKDGTKVPKGIHISNNQLAYHLDDGVFKNANTFDPWRMYNARQKSGEATKHQYVMTSDKNLHFGHGKHACPGRFFAANEIKALLVLVMMRFDVRVTNATWEEVKRGQFYSVSRAPSDKVMVEFKNRDERIPEDLKEMFL
ncbi:hypothetical protein FANTH_14585 [Fusarium anthophilum]|uniref:Cytochrome P450 monooxygenase n=1 Tax=Fusarium anthophilum TaxID=48485 RepID=A0A8H5DLL4_9HYPO|nr:hypothetical protein FANTH_14585 [Fusarium anthophilum]